MSDLASYSSRPVVRISELDPLLPALVGVMPEAALLLGGDGTLLMGNAAAAQMLGALRAGSPVSLTVRAPEIVEAVREVGGGAPPRLVSFNLRVPVDRAYEAHILPVTAAAPGTDARPRLILLVFRDLTQAMRIDQMRADFVANASHELRTPLASLAGFIDTLRGPARDDAVMREKFLGIMSEQARRMSRLIDDLLSLSRIELNAHIAPEAEADLVALAAHVRDSLSPLAQERGVEIALAAPQSGLRVRGDRDDLVRLMENLVENALKYGAGGKRVQIELKSGGGDAVVIVRDFGPGIAPEHLPRLTERFYRVDVAQSREQGGTGLGLAIVKHIAARHRGRLTIESERGRGAQFIVRIPLIPGTGANS
jgi:two-component system phosphate regulon sensor histidine kinase PhoR